MDLTFISSRRCRRHGPAALLTFALLSGGGALAQETGPDGADRAFAVHAGVVSAGVPVADFAAVRALSGQDLFAQVEARDRTADFAVFAAQRLWTGEAARLYASVGTGLRRPGATLYLGPSLGVSRLMVTGGVATASVPEGVGAVPDDVFRGGGDRQLFAGLEHRRHWGAFVAVSVAVYP